MKISNLIVCQSMRNIMDVVSFAVNSNDDDALLIYNALQEINEPREIFDYITFLDRLTEMLFVHNKEDLAAKLLMISFQNGFDISSIMKKYFESDVTDESSITSMLDHYSKNSFKERKFSKLLTEVEYTIFLDDPQEYANININHIKAAAYFGSEEIFHKIVELNLIPLDRVERRSILWYSLLGRNDEIINYCSKHFNDNRYNILIEYIRIEILHQYELTADVINRTDFMLNDLVNTLYFKFFLFYYKMNENNKLLLFSIEIPKTFEYLRRFLTLVSMSSCGVVLLEATKNLNDLFNIYMPENPIFDNVHSIQVINKKLNDLKIQRACDEMIKFDPNHYIQGMEIAMENFYSRAQKLLDRGAKPDIYSKSASSFIGFAILTSNSVLFINQINLYSQPRPWTHIMHVLLDVMINYIIVEPYSLIEMSVYCNFNQSIEFFIEKFDINMKFIPLITSIVSIGDGFLLPIAAPIFEYYQKFGEMELTFLMIAIIYNRYEIVENLLLHDANPNLKCNGVHPLKICRDESIRSLLIEYGAKP